MTVKLPDDPEERLSALISLIDELVNVQHVGREDQADELCWLGEAIQSKVQDEEDSR